MSNQSSDQFSDQEQTPRQYHAPDSIVVKYQMSAEPHKLKMTQHSPDMMRPPSKLVMNAATISDHDRAPAFQTHYEHGRDHDTNNSLARESIRNAFVNHDSNIKIGSLFH
jgi:hypothetical protein